MKNIVLPNAADYMHYIIKIIINSYIADEAVEAEVLPSPSVAKFLVNEEGYIVVRIKADKSR